jgi:hypothetical protein
MLYERVLRAFVSKGERHAGSGPVMQGQVTTATPLLRDGAGQEGPREAVVDDEGGVDVNRQ